jgi:chromosome partitioning protein
MAKIITLANLKGGVGKTSIAINLGMFLSALGKRVLLIDLSPRGDSTFCLGIKSSPNFIGDVLEKKIKPKAAIKSTSYFGYDVMPSFPRLESIILKLQGTRNAEIRLKQALQEVKDDYDFIIIDTAPVFDILMLNALFASEYLIIPVQCEYLAFRSAQELVSRVSLIKELSLQEPKFLLTMYVWRSRLSRSVSKIARKEFGEQVLSTVIPKASILAEEEQRKDPVLKSFPNSRPARVFRQLAEEILGEAEEV